MLPPPQPVRPLLADHARLWLTLYAGALVATTGAAFVLAARLPPENAAPLTPGALWPLTLLSVAFVAWGSWGVAAYRVLLAAPGHLALFISGSWALFVTLGLLNRNFTFLAFAVILQALVFLPYRWSILSVVLFTTLGFVNTVGARSTGLDLVGGVLLVLAIGGLFGALLVGTQRATEEARLRGALLSQLEVAQRTLAQREREAGVLSERARLSRELHDTLAQDLAAIVAQLAAAQIALPPAATHSVQALNVAQDIARVRLHHLRELVWALRPSELANSEIEAALTRLTAAWSQRNGIQSSFEVLGERAAIRPEPEVALLRIAQEALANAARHAHATRVAVQLTFEAEFVMLDVSDDGRGFDPERAPTGFGLLGMRERAEAFGGHLLLDSAPGEGATVTAVLPLSLVAVAAVPA